LCGFRSLRYFMQHVFIADYAFYYFQIARNIAHSGWATFDGIHSNGGAQLLWTGILSGVAFVVPDKILFLRAVFILSAALNALSGILFYRLGNTLHSQRAGVLAVLIWCGLVIRQHPTNMGTEFPLHILVILSIASVLIQVMKKAKPAKMILLGLLLTLNFWTRIDSICYSIFILIALGFLLKKSGNAQKVWIPPALICIAGAVVYAILC